MTTDPSATSGVDGSADQATRDAFRRWGYLEADLDWLGRLQPAAHPDLDLSGPAADRAREQYCGTLAVEFMHIADPARRRWVQERMESPRPAIDSDWVLEQLIRAATFESLLQSRYIGNKRFSIEGVEALVPFLNEMLDSCAEHGAVQAVLAMSHRGRLNVMGHVVGANLRDLFAGFEDVDPRSIMGAGDVKYHLGATGMHRSRTSGGSVNIHLVSNPSHLEAVAPVAVGRVWAKQRRLALQQPRDGDPRDRVVPIIMHGDAAFAGQGITAESLNMAALPAYDVGGTVHVIVNNWIGFTTEPPALHSTRFSSDLARRLNVPIFHVNGEDPEAVVQAARMAMEYRFEFHDEVVVDLIGFRRHGHSEVDDPTITQPVLYRKIADREVLWQSYARRLGWNGEATEKLAADIRDELSAHKEQAERLTRIPLLRQMPGYWSAYEGGEYRPEYDGHTALNVEQIHALTDALVAVPSGFNVHPKVAKLLEQRHKMGHGETPLDYGMAEALALASLVAEGCPVRMSGQDSRRGTFSHRHAVLVDFDSGAEYCPLEELAKTHDNAFFEIHNSSLSEASVMGFEYGVSRDYPEALVMWEAQFGDFANGAQVILDQFVTAGEDKWGLLSGLVLLLPHGFEGQGPEHSSARIERYLQLAAEDAIQIAQPTSAAQYFHLLRRQVLRPWRKPLVVFTPKSMLRAAAAASQLESLTRDRFLNVLPDSEVEQARRVLICTGKIVHELRSERSKRGITDVAIIAVEQLYPFPRVEMGRILERYESARDLVWVQEEPANMGALFFIVPRIEQVSRRRRVRTIKRAASASPATGSSKAHRMEQSAIYDLALS